MLGKGIKEKMEGANEDIAEGIHNNQSPNQTFDSQNQRTLDNNSIEKLVNQIFIDDPKDIPLEAKTALKEKDRIDFKHIEAQLFKENKCENLLSKENNKYLFRLLQIFGFKDEPLLSFIDKDHMKTRLRKAFDKKKYNKNSIFEQFEVTYMI